MRRALVLVVALFGLLPVPALADEPATPIITPIQAGAVLDDAWTQREAAVVDRDRSELTAVEEGPALAYDLAWMSGLVSDRPAGEGQRGLVGQWVVVPKQTAYPAFFLASVSVTNHADPTGAYDYWTAVLVLVRDDAVSPWRIRLETWAPTSEQADEIQQAFSNDGTEQFAAPPSSSMAALPFVTQLSKRYSLYRWPFAPMAVSPKDLFTVAMPDGSTMVCFGRSYVEHEQRPGWHPAKASARDERGIPEGFYSTLSSTFEDQQCGLIQDSGQSDSVESVSQTAGYVAHRETPATPPPWLWIGLIGCLLSAVVFWSVWRLRVPPDGDGHETLDVIRLTAFERHMTLQSTLRVLLGALVLIEVERWLIPADPLFGLIVAAVFLTPVLLRLIPARRTIRCTARILINKPADEIYAFIRDLRNEPQWAPHVLSVDLLTSSSTRRVYRSRQRLIGSAVLEYETHAEEQPDQRTLKYRLMDKWFPERAEWRLTPVPNGTVLTITRWFELGPVRAMAYGVRRYRDGLRRMTIRELNELRRIMVGEASPKPPAEISVGTLNWQYRMLRRIPGIGQSDIGITIASFMLFSMLYGWLLGGWFAAGIMVMLLVHELGHYVEGYRLGFRPRPPVFVLGGAFVHLPGVRPEPLNNARVSLAGGVAGSAATAIVLCVFALSGSPHLLPWAEAGAGANLFGSLMPFITVDVESILAVIGRWTPLLGLFAAVSAWAAATALGADDLLIPAIVVLAFVILTWRQPRLSFHNSQGLTSRARLAIGASWLALVAYLSVVFFLTAGWLN